MNKKQKHTDQNTFLADWLAGKLSDEGLKATVASDDFAVYKKIEQGFDSLEKPSIDVEAFYKKNIKLRQGLKHKKAKVRSLIPNWVYTAAAMLVVVFGVFQFFTAEIKQEATFGQALEVSLNEGTQVILNAKSHISYPKYQKQRTISLEGEAFFEVTKKGAFTVTTPQGKVSVLGTKFNLISQDDLFEVICFEGKVSVEHQGVSTVLSAGEAWRSIGELDTTQWNITGYQPSWLHAESSFRSMPVIYVLKNIENQYNISIKTNAINPDTLFTGSFIHDNLDTALRSVCLPLGLDYDVKENQSVVLSKK